MTPGAQRRSNTRGRGTRPGTDALACRTSGSGDLSPGCLLTVIAGRLLAVQPVSPGRGFGADQGGDYRIAAQLVQAAAAQRPDTTGRDAQGGADLGVGQGRGVNEQGEQLPATWRQAGERLAQRGVALGPHQFLL